MKKIVTISLIIFAIIVGSILLANLFPNQKQTLPKGSTAIPIATSSNSSTAIPIATSSNSSAAVAPASNSSVSASATKTFTSAQVSAHKSSSNCWLIISNQVYDVTSYIPKHPGGQGTIIPYCGTDATQAFTVDVPHSARAGNLLSNYFIGNLAN